MYITILLKIISGSTEVLKISTDKGSILECSHLIKLFGTKKVLKLLSREK